MSYKYLFGPVPSRRLGISLGVDMVPMKVCSLDCVYCEVGRTSKLTLDRMEYVKFDHITEELTSYFSSNPDPDYITFSGSGEPTLNSRLGDVIRYLKSKKPEIPIAVITNGTLLSDKKLRQELMDVDVLLPSLDAATQEVFEKLNRPEISINLDDYINGLVEFCKKFKGKIWLEVFILPGYNDHEEELMKLKKIIESLKVTSVQLNTLDRPGILSDLRPASRIELKKIVDFWDLDNVEIIAPPAHRKHIHSYREDAESAILQTIARRPCTAEDIRKMLGIPIVEINKYLDVLEAESRVTYIRQNRGLFYKLKGDVDRIT